METADCWASSVRKSNDTALKSAKSRPNECKMSTRFPCGHRRRLPHRLAQRRISIQISINPAGVMELKLVE